MKKSFLFECRSISFNDKDELQENDDLKMSCKCEEKNRRNLFVCRSLLTDIFFSSKSFRHSNQHSLKIDRSFVFSILMITSNNHRNVFYSSHPRLSMLISWRREKRNRKIEVFFFSLRHLRSCCSIEWSSVFDLLWSMLKYDEKDFLRRTQRETRSKIEFSESVCLFLSHIDIAKISTTNAKEKKKKEKERYSYCQ